LQKLADNLWWVSGDLPGMSLKRTMTVLRLDDGKLLLHSAIALEPAALAELERLGTPGYLIVPNRGHRLDAPAYKQRYPALRVFGPRGGRSAIEEVIPLDGTYETFPADAKVRVEYLQGVDHAEGVWFVRSNDGLTLIFNDAVFNMDRKRDVLGFLFTTILGSAPGPRISRLSKLLFIKDQAALRAQLLQLSELPDLTRVVVAHEKVASGPAAREALQKAASYLGI
jgi:hypothetical protein